MLTSAESYAVMSERLGVTTKCVKTGPCSCRTPDGVIDLSPLANKNNTARYVQSTFSVCVYGGCCGGGSVCVCGGGREGEVCEEGYSLCMGRGSVRVCV